MIRRAALASRLRRVGRPGCFGLVAGGGARPVPGKSVRMTAPPQPRTIFARCCFEPHSARLSRTCQGRFSKTTHPCRDAQARTARSTSLAAVMAMQLRRQEATPLVERVADGVAGPRQVDDVLVVDPA